MFTELSLGCWSSGHRNLYMYQVLSSKVFFFVSYMQIRPLYNVLLEVERNCLHMTLFVRSQSFFSPPSFMFVSAAVSEIRELNQNNKEEKNSEIRYFQFSNFPGHIIYPFLNQRYLLSTCTHSIC